MESKDIKKWKETETRVLKPSTSKVTCCVTTCSNNTGTVDERTGRYVRMHKFPDPVKEKERCHQWLVNLHRADLNFTNIHNKRVCSAHFDVSAYNCPSDIAHSSLLCSAVPTIVTYPNPLKTLATRRKPLLKRHLGNLKADNRQDKHAHLEKSKTAQHVTSETSQNDRGQDAENNIELNQLYKENEKLKKECEKLKKENEKLKQDNEKLTMKVNLNLCFLCQKDSNWILRYMDRKEREHILELKEKLQDSYYTKSYLNHENNEMGMRIFIRQESDFLHAVNSKANEELHEQASDWDGDDIKKEKSEEEFCNNKEFPHETSSAPSENGDDLSGRISPVASIKIECEAISCDPASDKEDAIYEESGMESHVHWLKGTILGKAFMCDICGAGFKQTRSLETHRRRHMGENPYKCSVCGKGFTATSTLTVHMRIHTGEKPYKCEICGVDFKQKGTLWRHKKMHTGEKSYICEICGAGFSQSSGLSNHKKIHTSEKPYICDICNVGFSQSSNLLRHKRKHTGEKPYKCEICGVGFSQICTLQKHKRKHTGEKPYRCDFCGAGFRYNSGLWSHKKIHTGEKDFKQKSKKLENKFDMCDQVGVYYPQGSTS